MHLNLCFSPPARGEQATWLSVGDRTRGPAEDPLGPGAPPGGGRRNGPPRPLAVTPTHDHAPPVPALLCLLESEASAGGGAGEGSPGTVTPPLQEATASTAAGVIRGICCTLSLHPGFRESDSEPSSHRFTLRNTPGARGEITELRGARLLHSNYPPPRSAALRGLRAIAP